MCIFTQPLDSPTHPHICININIYLGLYWFHTDLSCFYQSYICLEPAFGISLFFRNAWAAWTDIKILQTLSETTLCKRGWARKAFEILSPWGLAVCDGTQWPFCRVALCWVKAYCLQLLWIFVSLKSIVQRWTSRFTLWKPAEGDRFKHLQKT